VWSRSFLDRSIARRAASGISPRLHLGLHGDQPEQQLGLLAPDGLDGGHDLPGELEKSERKWPPS